MNDFQRIKDPAWVRESHEVVQKFLQEKSLSKLQFISGSPCATTSSFKQVMENCLQLIDPNSIIGDFKSDVPKILEKLGYPFRLNSGQWADCTTPANWPKLLFVLRWVVELCNYMDICKEDQWIVPEDPNSCVSLEKELEFYYEYIKSNNMDDILERYTEEVNEAGKEEMIEYEKLLVEVEKDRAALALAKKDKEIQQLGIMKLNEHRRRIEQTNSEIEGFKEKNSTLKMDIKCEDLEYQSLNEKKLSLGGRLEEVHRKIENQPMTSQELEDLKNRLSDLNDKFEETDLNLVYEKRQNRDLGEHLRSQFGNLVPIVNKFNELAKELGFTDSDSSGDALFEIETSLFDDFVKNGMNIGNAKEVVKVLETAKAQSENEVLEMKKNMKIVELHNHNLNNELEVLKNKRLLLEKNLMDIWEERKKMKIKFQEELKKLQIQCENKSFENKNNQHEIQLQTQAKRKELQSLKQEMADMKERRELSFQQMAQRINPEIFEMTTLVKEVDEMCKEDIDNLMEHLHWLEDCGTDDESFI